jgi:formylglycine-generating enzyme required for sulfatase activity
MCIPGNFVSSSRLAGAVISSVCAALVAAIVAIPSLSIAASPRPADTPLQPERRVALVIGNSSYKAAGISLPNPRNDAQDVSAVLATLGFEVVTAIDVSKRDMDFALQRFERLAANADAALFFYAGHAMQFQGRNFLMPTDAELEDEISVRHQTIAVEEVRAALDRANGIRIMILDACRNNPLANRLQQTIAGASRSVAMTRGLARVDKTQGMVVAYATAPDEVAQDGQGRNSPFTAALLKRLQEPGLEIEMMFRRVAADVNAQTGGRQRPETYISLLSEYYLNQSDRVAWDRIKDQDDITALRDFVNKYPSSPRASLARRQIEMLERYAKEREDLARRAREDEQRKAAEAEASRREAEERVRNELAARKRMEEEKKRQDEARKQEEEQKRQEAARREAERQEAERQQMAEQKPQEALRQQQAALQAREEQRRQDALRQQPRTDPSESQQGARPPAPVTGLPPEPKPGEVFRDCSYCPELVVVPSGEFVMGSSKEDIDDGLGATNEAPQHSVFIKQPIAVGRFEVTRDQFEAFIGGSGRKVGDRCYTLENNTPRERTNRSFRNPGYAQSGAHPAVCVNWQDAKAYVEWLSQRTGKPYRLLSEAEWEYVARAGSTLPHGFGKDATEVCKYANGADQSARLAMLPADYAYMNCTDSYPYTAPVGSFRPNALGLFDLLGNVWEWTEDCFYDDYRAAPSDGSARSATACQGRTVRGGSWFSTGNSLRPAIRAKANDNNRYDDVGFRVVRALVP